MHLDNGRVRAHVEDALGRDGETRGIQRHAPGRPTVHVRRRRADGPVAGHRRDHPVRGDSADAVVAAVDEVDGSVRGDGDRTRAIELCVDRRTLVAGEPTEPVARDDREGAAVPLEDLVAVGIRDEHPAVGRHGERPRADETGRARRVRCRGRARTFSRRQDVTRVEVPRRRRAHLFGRLDQEAHRRPGHLPPTAHPQGHRIEGVRVRRRRVFRLHADGKWHRRLSRPSHLDRPGAEAHGDRLASEAARELGACLLQGDAHGPVVALEVFGPLGNLRERLQLMEGRRDLSLGRLRPHSPGRPSRKERPASEHGQPEQDAGRDTHHCASCHSPGTIAWSWHQPSRATV